MALNWAAASLIRLGERLGSVAQLKSRRVRDHTCVCVQLSKEYSFSERANARKHLWASERVSEWTSERVPALLSHVRAAARNAHVFWSPNSRWADMLIDDELLQPIWSRLENQVKVPILIISQQQNKSA